MHVVIMRRYTAESRLLIVNDNGSILEAHFVGLVEEIIYVKNKVHRRKMRSSI